MLDLLLIPVAILYLLVVGLLFCYGINFLYLTILALRIRPGAEPDPPGRWPAVTVQLPIYNERYVAARLITAVARLEYPCQLLEIQVLDDSTDETRAIARRAVARARAQGLDITHIHRPDRTGFKAGALQVGLQRARGDLIAIFDADFVPAPDFLRRTVPHFHQDARLAFVQTRWAHLNRDYSLLTALQSLAIDAHFMVEQFARSLGGYLFNFNGTAGVWRRAAMLDAGGWTADTLTEDLDLSYRAYLRGWVGCYRRDVAVPAELPVHFSGFRRQQHRWARGSLECALKLAPRVWRTDLPRRHKVQATLHLTGYVVHLLLFLLVFLYPLILLLSQRYPDLISLFGLAYVFNLTALAPTCFFAAGQQQLNRDWKRLLPRILFIMVLGSGLMVNTVRAAGQILLRRQAIFERTAKFGIERRDQRWTNKRYQLQLDPIVLPELLLAFLNLMTVGLALKQANWAIAFYAGLFGLGLLFVATLTIQQALAVRREQRAVTRPMFHSLDPARPLEESPSAPAD